MNFSMPPVTKNLLIINFICFLAMLVGEQQGFDLVKPFGLHFFLADDFNPFQLITYMFMHGSFAHIFFNMFAVFMFGRTLEMVWGSKRFLFYYLFTGIGAGLIQELVQCIYYYSFVTEYFSNPDAAIQLGKEFNNLVTIGASGGVYGILLGFGMLFPNQSLFIIPIPVPIKAKYFVAGYAILELIQGLKDNANDNVAHFAHLGGMIFGVILILYWRKTGKEGHATFFQ